MGYYSYLKDHKHKVILFTSIALYTLIFSISTIIKHGNFYSYAWDLGVFNQAIYNSLFSNKLLHYTCDSYLNIKENYLAFHFSPILGLMFPIYYVFPYVSTLLVVKSLLLALGAYPLYLLGLRITGKKTHSLVIALVYLIQPGLQASNWFDFQPQVFIPILLFSTFLFFIDENWKYFFPTLLLSLFIEEHVFIIYGTMLMGYFLVERSRIKELLDPKNSLTQSVFASFIIILLVFLIGVYTKSLFPVNETYLDIFQTSKSYEVLEFKGSGFVLPFYILKNPGKGLIALSHDFDLKLLYIIFIYAPLLFLPFFNIFTLPSTFLYIPFLFSNYRAYYTLGAHYYLYLVTPLFISTLYSLRDWQNDSNKIPKQLLVLSIFFILLLSPLSPASKVINRDQEILWYPDQSRTKTEIDNLKSLIEDIPDKESILTMNHIFPHVSGQLNSYVIPVIKVEKSIENDLKSYVNGLINKSDYILLDLNVMDYWSKYTFEKMVEMEEFGIWKNYGSAVLFARDVDGMKLPGQSDQEFHFSELNLGSHTELVDEDLQMLVAKSGKGIKPSLFAYGPYTFLPEGNYRIVYNIKVMNSSSPLIGYLKVTRDLEKVVTTKNIWSYKFQDEKWHDVELVIGVDEVSMLTEFQLYSYGVADIYLNKINVYPLDTENVTSSTRSFFNSSLVVPNGMITDEGIIVSTNETENVLWYGPYYRVNPGIYDVEYNLRAFSKDINYNGNIITLDIISSKELIKLAEYNLTSDNYESGEWITVTLQINLSDKQILEFRGLYPSDKWIIELSEITLNPVS